MVVDYMNNMGAGGEFVDYGDSDLFDTIQQVVDTAGKQFPGLDLLKRFSSMLSCGIIVHELGENEVEHVTQFHSPLVADYVAIAVANTEMCYGCSWALLKKMRKQRAHTNIQAYGREYVRVPDSVVFYIKKFT